MFLDHMYHHELAKTTFLADLSLAAWPRRSTFSAVIHSPRVELATIAKHKDMFFNPFKIRIFEKTKFYKKALFHFKVA